nr:hypothetical protein [Tanacetum cinerariifolium]
MLSRISFHVLYGRGVTIMVSEPGYETVGSKDLSCEDWMVNTRTDADLSAAVQNALQTLLPQIRVEIREEFRTSFGPSDAGGNPPPVTIYTWLERFNKQKPHSFEKATAPVDAKNWIFHMEKIFDVLGGEDAFKTRLAERLKREYHSIRQTSTETSTEFMQRFFRLAGFLGAAAGTEEEQAKNFQWCLRRSTLNHLMCMSYTDVAQVANAARNYEILHERDDEDTERPDKRHMSSDRHQPTSHSNNNYSSSNNRNSGYGRDQRNRGHQSNQSANSGSQQSRGPSEGYSYPVCTTCGRRHTGECRRAAGTCFKYGQAGHLQKDCKKNTTASTSGQADKKPGASGRVFALFDTGATHSVISYTFASRITTTPTLLDHVLCISTPMQDSVRITHIPLQFNDKIRAINALPLDMCEFDIILGMDWLT